MEAVTIIGFKMSGDKIYHSDKWNPSRCMYDKFQARFCNGFGYIGCLAGCSSGEPVQEYSIDFYQYAYDTMKKAYPDREIMIYQFLTD
jgi:hypothetical protein